MNTLIRRALVALATLPLVALAMPDTALATPPNSGSLAWFEDHWIDLSVDWEEATACEVGTSGTFCYRTERELLAAARRAAAMSSAGALAATCGSSLRLYDGISYSGNVLMLSLRWTTLNLSTFGFDNLTTSYKVGGCDAEFYSGAGLSGSAYPGNTSATAQAATMSTGWNNLVSSVYIN